MTEVKRPPSGSAVRGHAGRDMSRGFQTKHMVKGAAGGARGVDYQDHEAEYKERLEKQAPAKPGAGAGKPEPASTEKRAQNAPADKNSRPTQRNPAEVIVYDRVQAPREKINNPIKFEDERPKKKIIVRTEEQESEAEDADSSAEVIAANELLGEPNDDAHREHLLNTIAQVLQDPAAERQVFGAMVLTDPEQMRKTLGTPVRVAKHLLVLAGRLMQKGQERGQVVEYLANTFLALGPDFGKRAFKDFAGSIGIGAVYPLEVHERLLLLDDKFLTTTKCRFTSGKRLLLGRVKEPIVLEYPEDIRITEFAVKGGTRNGYQLVPLKEKGKYGLRLFQPGEYRLLLLGIDTMGFERLEEIRVQVTGEVTVPVERPVQARPTRSLGDIVKSRSR